MPLPSANFFSHGRERLRGFEARREPVSAGKAGVHRRVERGAPIVFFIFLLRNLFMRLSLTWNPQHSASEAISLLQEIPLAALPGISPGG